jgi:hypothetical protein
MQELTNLGFAEKQTMIMEAQGEAQGLELTGMAMKYKLEQME